MMTLAEQIYAIKPNSEGWRTLPNRSKVYVGKNLVLGACVQLGDMVYIQDNVTINDYVTIGHSSFIESDVVLGTGVILSDSVQILSRTHVGQLSFIGSRSIIVRDVKIPSGTVLGNTSFVGSGVSDAIDLGHVEGYRKVLCNVQGVAYIGAGCRWFPLADAIEHWKYRNDRPLTRILMHSAVKIAKHKGWTV